MLIHWILLFTKILTYSYLCLCCCHTWSLRFLLDLFYNFINTLIFKWVKGEVYNSNPIYFLSNSENMNLCVLKKQSGIHTQPWLCKWETNRVDWVTPPTQVVKYQRFSYVSTIHFSILCHNLCSYTGQTNAVSYLQFEGALMEGVYLFGCWVQISTSFLWNCRLQL